MPDTASSPAPFDGLRQRLDAAESRTLAVVERLHAAARRRRTRPDAWCVDEILDHVATTAGLYVAPLRRTLDAAKAKGPRVTPGLKHTWIGNMLLGAVKPGSRPMKAPGVFRPRVTPTGESAAHDAIDRMRAANESLRGFMSEAAGVESSRAKLSSPALALIRLNVDDALESLVLHAERHLGQIERTAVALESH